MKFSIRDVLWLTVVAALAVGWGIDRARVRESELRARGFAERAWLEAARIRALQVREVELVQVLEHHAANVARAAETSTSAEPE